MAFDIFEIEVNHELWNVASRLSKLSGDMYKVRESIAAMKETLTKSDVYEGKGRKEMDLFLEAYDANIYIITKNYMYCSQYVNDTLNTMMEFDEDLKKKFEEGLICFIQKDPKRASEIFGGQG